MRTTDEAGIRLEERMKKQISLMVSRLELLNAFAEESGEAMIEQIRGNVLQLYGACRRYCLGEALEKGTLTMEKTALSASDLLQRIWMAATPCLLARGVELTLDAPGGLCVVGDAQAVERILWLALSARVAAGDRAAALCAEAQSNTVWIRLRGSGAAPSGDGAAEAREREALALALARCHGSEPQRAGDGAEFAFSLEAVSVEALSRAEVPVAEGILQAEIELAGL